MHHNDSAADMNIQSEFKIDCGLKKKEKQAGAELCQANHGLS